MGIFYTRKMVQVELTVSWSASSGTAPSKPRTCPYFVSDPPGSQILSSTFPVSGFPGLLLALESYQLATDQTQAVM